MKHDINKKIWLCVAIIVFVSGCGGAGNVDVSNSMSAAENEMQFAIGDKLVGNRSRVEVNVGGTFEFQPILDGSFPENSYSCELIAADGATLDESDGGTVYCDGLYGSYTAPVGITNNNVIGIKVTIDDDQALAGLLYVHVNELKPSDGDSAKVVSSYSSEFAVGVNAQEIIMKVGAKSDVASPAIVYNIGVYGFEKKVEWDDQETAFAAELQKICNENICREIQPVQVASDMNGNWIVLIKIIFEDGVNNALYLGKIGFEGLVLVSAVSSIPADARMLINDQYVHVVYVNETPANDKNVYYDRCDLDTLACGADVAVLSAVSAPVSADIAVEGMNVYLVAATLDGGVYFKNAKDNGINWERNAKMIMSGTNGEALVRIFVENGRIDVFNFANISYDNKVKVLKNIQSMNSGLGWSVVDTLDNDIPNGIGELKMSSVKDGNIVLLTVLKARTPVVYICKLADEGGTNCTTEIVSTSNGKDTVQDVEMVSINSLNRWVVFDSF